MAVPGTLVDVQDNETALVTAAQSGDIDAFGLLVERSWEPLVRLSRSIVGDLEAEDAVQDGLLAAWRRLGTLSNAASFIPWLTRIVFRRCLRRTRRLWRFLPIELAPEPSGGADPSSDAAVWSILSRLAPQQRAVLHLTVVEGMTDSEIAATLGIKPASVRAHRRRARERLAGLLKGDSR